MILPFCMLALLLASSTEAQRIKGGRRIIQEPVIQGSHVFGGKGGGGRGALHHTAVVQDPLSGSPVVVQQVSPIGGGIKTGGFGADSAQYSVHDGLFGRRLYRTGASQFPYGLMGSDYYSYPVSMYTAPRRVLRRKSVVSPNLSGLRPIGFSAGDAQIKTGVFGSRRNLYRTGLSPVPYGLMGMDYYSYPNQLLTQQRLVDGFGDLGQSHILGGASAFTADDSQLRGGFDSSLGQEKVTVVETDPLGGGQRVTTIQKAASPVAVKTTGGLRGGQIILNGAPRIGGLRRLKTRPVVATGLAAPLGGFGQRQIITRSAAPIIQAPVAPVQIIQAAPAPIVQTRVAAPIIHSTPLLHSAPVQTVQVIPQRSLYSRRPIDTLFSQMAAPRQVQRVITRSAAPTFIAARPAVYSAPKTIFSAPQPQVLSRVKTSGLIGNRIFGRSIPQMMYIDGGRQVPGIDIIGGSRIGDPRMGYSRLPMSLSRFANIGLPSKIGGFSRSPLSVLGGGAATKTITQEEVIGPAGDPQVVTTVTKHGPSKIGGLASGSALGLAGPGKTSPSKVVTQEETVGPFGERQVVTTVSDNGANRLAGSKIGGFAAGSGLGIARSAPAQVITQEEVIGPAGDPQVITTVHQGDSSPAIVGSSKIGGLASGSALGLAGLGKTSPSKIVSQEETVGPFGERQVVTTVTDTDSNRLVGSKIGGLAAGSGLGVARPSQQVISQEEVVGPTGDSHIVTTLAETNPVIQQVSQDPIETALAQEALGDSLISGPLSQSAIDPLGSGQTQLALNDVIDSPVTQVRETNYVDPSGGNIVKVTEVSQSPASTGGLVQQNIADSIVQESIGSDFGGALGYGYSPRLSFMSQFPYDAPDSGILRSMLTSPIVQQQQQEVEQILIKK